jgi:hypothetical protein
MDQSPYQSAGLSVALGSVGWLVHSFIGQAVLNVT